MKEQDVALPASVEQLWRRDDRTRRGPKRGLTLDQVVDAGIELADAEGLGAVSMSRVAERVGFTTMSLYRYVSSKDELLALMQDEACGVAPEVDSAMGWRAALERWSYDNFESLRRHAWILQLPITGPPIGPKQLTWLESGLRCLAATPLSEGEKAGVIQLLAGYALSEARLSADMGRPEHAGNEPVAGSPTYGGILSQLIDADSFPALTAAVAAGVFDDPEGYTDADFDFGLQRTLDGIEMFITTRSKRPARRRR